MAQTPTGLSRRALMGAAAVVAVVGGTAFSLRSGPSLTRRSTSDSKTFNRGNSAEPDSLDPQKIQTAWENNIVGDMFMGIDLSSVQELMRYQEMASVPLAPLAIEGLINLRGQIVTALASPAFRAHGTAGRHR